MANELFRLSLWHSRNRSQKVQMLLRWQLGSLYPPFLLERWGSPRSGPGFAVVVVITWKVRAPESGSTWSVNTWPQCIVCSWWLTCIVRLFVAHQVEHCTTNIRVMGSIPREVYKIYTSAASKQMADKLIKMWIYWQGKISLVAKWKSLNSVRKIFQNILIISENVIHKFKMKMNPLPSSKLIWSLKKQEHGHKSFCLEINWIVKRVTLLIYSLHRWSCLLHYVTCKTRCVICSRNLQPKKVERFIFCSATLPIFADPETWVTLRWYWLDRQHKWAWWHPLGTESTYTHTKKNWAPSPVPTLILCYY